MGVSTGLVASALLGGAATAAAGKAAKSRFVDKPRESAQRAISSQAAQANARMAEEKRVAEEKAAADARAKEEQNKKKLSQTQDQSRRAALSSYLAQEGGNEQSRRRFLIGAK